MNASEAIQQINDRTAKVVVVGQGYVGLPVAMRAVEVGFTVVGFEASADRVKSLLAGESYVGDISDDELTGPSTRATSPRPIPPPSRVSTSP